MHFWAFLEKVQVESLPSSCTLMCSASFHTNTHTAVVCVPWGQEDSVNTEALWWHVTSLCVSGQWACSCHMGTFCSESPHWGPYPVEYRRGDLYEGAVLIALCAHRIVSVWCVWVWVCVHLWWGGQVCIGQAVDIILFQQVASLQASPLTQQPQLYCRVKLTSN